MNMGRLYAIADVETLRRRGVGLREFAEGLRAAGVGLVQLRDKAGSPAEVLAAAYLLREVMGDDCTLIMNDRADLGLLSGFDGVHVGQGDLSVADAWAVMAGSHSSRSSRDEWGTGFVVGVSTHTEAQVRATADADYVAVGPVFATGTKLDAEATVGLDGVRRARALTPKPLVAIGGITRANARSVLEAGADAVAVISGLLVEGETVEEVARDFLRILG